MFELKKETHIIRGIEITIQEIPSGVLADMDDSVSALVAASVIPEMSQAEVAEWPSEVVIQIAKFANNLNGFDQGNE
jgi:hypothetical protein